MTQFEALKEIQELFLEIDTQEDQLELLMDYGKELQAFPSEKMVESNKVPGCISNAYISYEVKEGLVYYQGFSEALVVKGYIAILVHGLSGHKPEDILEFGEEKVNEFLATTNVQANLTPSRANAFQNVFSMMRLRAQEVIRDGN